MKYHMQKYHCQEYNKIKECDSIPHQAGPSVSQTQPITKLRQPSVMDSFKSRKIWEIHANEARQFHYLIGEMICTDNQPYSIVSDIGFSRLMKKAVPNYQIPSDKYFREKIVPDIFTRCKAKIAQRIEKLVGKASFTSDIWTCQYTNNSFLSFTIHFIDNDNSNPPGLRSNFVLACKHFPGSHTGEAISLAFNSLLAEWEIPRDKIHLIIVDNAANMKRGLLQANLNFEGCFIHTLQLVINDAIRSQRSVNDIIAKARKIVSHFNHSQTACDKLIKLQEQLIIPKHKLIQDIQTRWNSTFYMLSRLLEQKKAINLYIIDHPTLVDLKYGEWELLTSILNLLNPFEEMTKMASSSECCISEVIPFISTINAYFKKENNSFAGVGIIKEELKSNLDSRFGNVFLNENYTISTFLDPRFKDNFFQVNHKSQHSQLKDLIRTLKNRVEQPNALSELTDNQIDVDNNSTDSENEPLAKHVRRDLKSEKSQQSSSSAHDRFWKTYEEFFVEASSKRNPSLKSVSEILELEIAQYNNLPVIAKTSNPLLWWKEKQDVLPLLYSQAVIYLSAPPSSVFSEQMFSEAGIVNSAKRNRLNPSTAESLIFLHNNLQKLDFDY